MGLHVARQTRTTEFTGQDKWYKFKEFFGVWANFTKGDGMEKFPS
jgi:hypothetical protein